MPGDWIQTITVRYSCRDCGLIDVQVPVAVRGAEDVGQWMDGVLLPALANDHRTRSPRCSPRTLANVKIPMPEGVSRVGDAPSH